MRGGGVGYTMTDHVGDPLPEEARVALEKFLRDHREVFEALARDSLSSNTITKKRNKSR